MDDGLELANFLGVTPLIWRGYGFESWAVCPQVFDLDNLPCVGLLFAQRIF